MTTSSPRDLQSPDVKEYDSSTEKIKNELPKIKGLGSNDNGERPMPRHQANSSHH